MQVYRVKEVLNNETKGQRSARTRWDCSMRDCAYSVRKIGCRRLDCDRLWWIPPTADFPDAAYEGQMECLAEEHQGRPPPLYPSSKYALPASEPEVGLQLTPVVTRRLSHVPTHVPFAVYLLAALMCSPIGFCTLAQPGGRWGLTVSRKPKFFPRAPQKTRISSSVPQEIIDHTTHHLHDEATTLKACCIPNLPTLSMTYRIYNAVISQAISALCMVVIEASPSKPGDSPCCGFFKILALVRIITPNGFQGYRVYFCQKRKSSRTFY